MPRRLCWLLAALAASACSGGGAGAPAPVCTSTCPVGAVEVAVVGPSGASVPGASASLRGPSCPAEGCACSPAQTGGGALTCPAAAGSYTVEARAAGYLPAAIVVVVPGGPAPCRCGLGASVVIRVAPDPCAGVVPEDDHSPCTADACDPATGKTIHTYVAGCGGPVPAPPASGPGSPVTIDGSAYLAWTEAGAGFRLLCRSPCPLGDEVVRALYGGMIQARDLLVGLAGLDVLSSLRPVDVHVNAGGACEPFTVTVAGYATVTPDFRGRLCLYSAEWSDAPPPYLKNPLTVEDAGRLERLMLFVHEYGHLLFFGRHEVSWEGLVRGLSYHVGGLIVDPCDPSLQDLRAGLLLHLCQQAGFGFRHLAPALQALETVYRSGQGEVDPFASPVPSTTPLTSARQLRLELEALLGKDTLQAFLDADEVPFNWLGDSVTLTPAGGQVPIYRGRVLLQVPPGAVSAPLAVTVRSVRHFPPPLELRWADFAFRTAILLEPAGTVFSAPITVTLPYDASLMPAGGSETGLAMWTAHDDFAAFSTRLAGSAVDLSAHTVAAPITELGLLYVAP